MPNTSLHVIVHSVQHVRLLTCVLLTFCSTLNSGKQLLFEDGSSQVFILLLQFSETAWFFLPLGSLSLVLDH